jgi:hypothetical protein
MKQGTSTGTVLRSPERRKREAKRRRRQEARWAAKSGPVVVRSMSEQERAEHEAPSR